MKFFILLALVVVALAEDQASAEHKLKGYKAHSKHGGFKHYRGRRDAESQEGVVAADQSSDEFFVKLYSGLYGGYGGYHYGAYNPGYYGRYYPTPYGYGYPYGGYFGAHRWRRDTEAAQAAPVAEVPAAPVAAADAVAPAVEVQAAPLAEIQAAPAAEAPAAADLRNAEHRYHHYHGYSHFSPSFGYSYPSYGYSNYGYGYPNYGYGYPSYGNYW